MNDQETIISKPKQFLTSALRAVRGENTQELVEAFTSEMTLVAEGLCEDQSRIRSAAEELSSRVDRMEQESGSELRHLEKALDTYAEKTDKRFSELQEKLDKLEKEISRGKSSQKIGRFHLPSGFMKQLIILASIIAGAWVIVSILQLFR